MSLGKIVSKITRKKAWHLIYVFLGIYPCMSCMLKFWYTFMITYSNFWYTFVITCSNFMVIVKICTGLQHNINWITQHIWPKISKSGCGLRGKVWAKLGSVMWKKQRERLYQWPIFIFCIRNMFKTKKWWL